MSYSNDNQSCITEELEEDTEKLAEQKVAVGGGNKSQIKLIENPTKRHVTFSRRRIGIFKKAYELTVLCDAKVFVIMISNNYKLHQYISPSLKTKDFLDQYRNFTNIDLWKTQYEAMQQTLRQHKERNDELRRAIRQRLGHDLSDMSYDELCALEQSMSSAVEVISERKFHKIRTQTETTRKKVKSLKQTVAVLMHEFQSVKDPPHGLAKDHEGRYELNVQLHWQMVPPTSRVVMAPLFPALIPAIFALIE